MNRGIGFIILVILPVVMLLYGHAHASGTLFLTDDSAGGDCPGIWDGPSKTCTLTADLTINTPGADGIVIVDNGITLDGGGYVLTGTGSGTGVYYHIAGIAGDITVRNVQITNFQIGIGLYGEGTRTVTGNTVFGNSGEGIHVSAPNSAVIYQNDLINNGTGVYLMSALDTQVFMNNFIGNTTQAFSLTEDDGVSFSGENTAVGGNFWDDYDSTAEGCTDTDSDGFCDAAYGAPDHLDIFARLWPYRGSQYLVDDNGGDCSLIGSWDPASKTCTLNTDITTTVHGQNAIALSGGNLTLDGDNHVISGSGSAYGVYAAGHPGITGSYTVKNIQANSFYNGIVLFGAGHREVIGTQVSDNTASGLYLSGSDSATITKNTLSTNGFGAYLSSVNQTSVSVNNFQDNTTQAISSGDNSEVAFDGGQVPPGGNYWSDYSTAAQGCFDSNYDGYCDTAYNLAGNSDRFPRLWAYDGHVEVAGTIFIRDDATGGDCTSVGIWDSAAKVCTLTSDINIGTENTNGIEIQSGQVTINGYGHSLIGTGSGTGVGVYYDGNYTPGEIQVRGLNVVGFYNGIALFGMGTRSVYGNTVADNLAAGVYLSATDQVSIVRNDLTNNGIGVFLEFVSNLSASRNNFINNGVQAETVGSDSNVEFNHLFIPPGGNYWNDFDEPSEGCSDGDGDGFCDVPYAVPGGNQDRFPRLWPYRGALYVIDETGGDCSLFGNWNGGDATCTLERDITLPAGSAGLNGIQIINKSGEALDRITIDGNGHYITGNGTAYGLYSEGSWPTNEIDVRNMIVNQFYNGIAFFGGLTFHLNDNIVSGHAGTGIYLSATYDGTTVTRNQISDNLGFGLFLMFTDGVLVHDNNFLENTIQARDSFGGSGNLFNTLDGGNYWSNFDEPGEGCNDIDLDGICDVPYGFDLSSDNLPLTELVPIQDSCPTDPLKTEPGICGCGVADTDTDGDGTPDCNDLCPVDPGKIEPGSCGCGIPDSATCGQDEDEDGIPDSIDQCAATPPGLLVNENGCAIQDICACDSPWKNHGAYVRCVAHASEDFLLAGLIDEAEKDVMVSTAALSSCGWKK